MTANFTFIYQCMIYTQLLEGGIINMNLVGVDCLVVTRVDV